MQDAARAAQLNPPLERFYFLRHGQTDYNLKDIVQGWVDAPLNGTGEQQALAAAQAFREQGITGLYASSLSRARRTAQIVSLQIQAPLLGEDKRLWEKGFGQYENAPGRQVQPNAWAMMDRGVEGHVEFVARTIDGLKAGFASSPCPLIVAHGGTRRILLWALGLENTPDLMDNALPLEFLRVGTGWSVNILR